MKQAFQRIQRMRQNRLPHFKINSKRILQLLIPLFFIIIAVALIRNVARLSQSKGNVESTDIQIQKSQAVATIDRDFKFPLKDSKEKDAGEFTYTIKSAELQKEIIVKGKKATAVSGRIFLIINLKITNTLNQGFQINSRDYIRLSINGNEGEWLAPTIHNDPVQVQAISTGYTRVGFTLNESDHNHRLRVGEIDGKKETIELKFNKN